MTQDTNAATPVSGIAWHIADVRTTVAAALPRTNAVIASFLDTATPAADDRLEAEESNADACAFDSIQSPKHHDEGDTLRSHLCYILLQYERILSGAVSLGAEFDAIIRGLPEREFLRYLCLHDLEKELRKTYKFEKPDQEQSVLAAAIAAVRRQADAIAITEEAAALQLKTIFALKDRGRKEAAKARRHALLESYLRPLTRYPRNLQAQGILVQNMGHEILTQRTLDRYAVTPRERTRLFMHMMKSADLQGVEKTRDPLAESAKRWTDFYFRMAREYCDLSGRDPKLLTSEDVLEMKRIYALSIVDSMGSKGETTPPYDLHFREYAAFVERLLKENADPKPQKAVLPAHVQTLGGTLREKFRAVAEQWEALRALGDEDAVRTHLTAMGLQAGQIETVLEALRGN